MPRAALFVHATPVTNTNADLAIKRHHRVEDAADRHRLRDAVRLEILRLNKILPYRTICSRTGVNVAQVSSIVSQSKTGLPSVDKMQHMLEVLKPWELEDG